MNEQSLSNRGVGLIVDSEFQKCVSIANRRTPGYSLELRCVRWVVERCPQEVRMGFPKNTGLVLSNFYGADVWLP